MIDLKYASYSELDTPRALKAFNRNLQGEVKQSITLQVRIENYVDLEYIFYITKLRSKNLLIEED